MADAERRKKLQRGMTGPMSLALPEPLDTQKNDALVEELKAENNYEGHKETEKRKATLRVLSQANQEFVRHVSRKQGLPASQINQFGGKVYPYGSYRLGVFGPGSDIDTLAVAPRHIKRDDFFAFFPDVLKRVVEDALVKESGKQADERFFTAGITSSVPVADAFVPIIKLVLNGIEIDLIFASITTLPTIPPKLDLNDNALLMGLDQSSIRAITGPRVTDVLLSLIPEPKTFRTALRAIKLWAKRRAVYANIVGYPGGIAWALMVARVCQFYPHAVGATLVDRFFYIMTNWGWPTPVMLQDIEHPKPEQAAQGFKVWNPAIYKQDKGNLMPIITPAFPSMCSTFNVTDSTKKIILGEIKRASKITQNIFAGKAQWGDLFKKHTFFTSDHKYYLTVIASAFDADAAKKWSGLVESKVRHLVMRLEDMKEEIVLARPYTKGYKRVHHCMDDSQIREVQKGSLKYKTEETKTVETTAPELVTTNGNATPVPLSSGDAAAQNHDAHAVYTYTYYIGINTVAKGSLNLVPAFQAFKSICSGWPQYNPEVHFLNLAVSKSWELPEDLFDPKVGEVRPSKPVKKVVKTTTAETKPVRRSINEVEGAPTNGEAAAKRPRLMTPTTTPTPTAAPA